MVHANPLSVLADPMRQQIIEILSRGEKSVGELAAELPVTRPAVSLHLQALARAGLVQVRLDGRFRRYRLQQEALSHVGAQIARWSASADSHSDGDLETDEVDQVVSTSMTVWPTLDGSALAFLTRLQLLGRLTHTLLASVAREFGITGPDVILLGTLRRLGPPFMATPTRLSQSAVLRLPVMLKRLEQLRRRDLIARATAPDDGRVSLVILTDRGCRLIDRIITHQFQHNFRALAELPREERIRLAESLRALLRSFRRLADTAQTDRVPAGSGKAVTNHQRPIRDAIP